MIVAPLIYKDGWMGFRQLQEFLYASFSISYCSILLVDRSKKRSSIFFWNRNHFPLTMSFNPKLKMNQEFLISVSKLQYRSVLYKKLKFSSL